MIDYTTWCAIRDGVAQHLTAPQLAASLALDVKTVRHWIGRPYAPRTRAPRASKLYPFKGCHRRLARRPSAHRPAGVPAPARRRLRGRHQHRQGLCAHHPSAPARGLPDARVRPRRTRPGRLGGMGHHRRWRHAPAALLLRHDAGLQPADVRRIYAVANHGAVPGRAHQRLQRPGCAREGDGRQSAHGGAAPRARRAGAVQSPLSRFRASLRLRARRLQRRPGQREGVGFILHLVRQVAQR